MISFTARDHRVKHGDDHWDHRRLDRRTREASWRDSSVSKARAPNTTALQEGVLRGLRLGP